MKVRKKGQSDDLWDLPYFDCRLERLKCPPEEITSISDWDKSTTISMLLVTTVISFFSKVHKRQKGTGGLVQKNDAAVFNQGLLQNS